MSFNRILVVNDIPGAGKVAANVNIPILAAAQLEVGLLPTVLLSTQTGGFYQNIIRHEVQDDFMKIMNHWQQNEIHYDAHLTGYFSTEEQIIAYTHYYEKEKEMNPDTLLIMDPIMADNGIYYDGFDPSITDKFSMLAKHCDLIFPNITEACLMANYPYKEDLSLEELDEISDLILAKGVSYSVITGVRFPEKFPNKIGFYVKGGKIKGQWLSHNYYNDFYFGTGDIAVSSIVAWYSKGESLLDAIKKTGPIIEEVIEKTIALKRDKKLGLYFESSLSHFYNS